MTIILGEKRTASVRAITYCEIFVLSKVDFNFFKSEYPEFKDVLMKISSEKSEKYMHLIMDNIVL